MENISHRVIIASVYYNRADWHIFIRFIYPHLSKAFDAGMLNCFYMQLNTYRGDHVKLVIHPAAHCESLEERFSELISNFLECHPSADNEVAYPVNDFFMPYPNNSVWINHNRNQTLLYTDKSNAIEDLQMQVSLAMVAALGDEEITLESTVSFLVYMHLVMLYTICDDFRQAQVFLNELIYSDQTKLPPEEIRNQEKESAWFFFQQLFDENRMLLVQMVYDVWKLRDEENGMEWLDTWKNNCKHFLDGRDLPSSFFHLSGLIANQANFTSAVSLSSLTLKLIHKLLSYIGTHP
ncbi:hypothetical protein [Sphingobacterium corticibacterium]|uniref:Thiopeptide-type bacteriocin biosynthesis domain-containing protein n=1 Tax=Sphingobacterium corticibacterium TaxID=2484746 RepID=A0A4Q6XJH3_9SPHI|nr:hypothetical protein [Sphingobacterium corticibacterium]RZF60230.1 hypothetical protein EWE74_14075 [Sphingobacterium corticibacterium]